MRRRTATLPPPAGPDGRTSSGAGHIRTDEESDRVHVVARIYDPRRAAIYQRLGIATVATVAWTTERVLRRIVPDEAAVEWIDPSARVSLVERSISSAWAGRLVSDIEELGQLRVAAV